MKHTITAVLLALPVFILAQTNGFSIRGKIGKLDAPVKAYIYYQSGDNNFRDSAVLKKGVFFFKGTIEQPSRSTVIIDEHRFTFYVEPGAITMESPDSAANTRISGTPLNTDLNDLRLALKPAGNKAERDEIMKQFIKAHPASLVSFDALKEYASVMPDPVRVEPVYDYLSDGLKANKAVAAYYTMPQDLKKTAIGQQAPDFTQADTAGNNVSLHDFKGKYVLVDFWASWCKPCRHENPAVVSAFNEYKDKGFTILSVSLDAPGAKEKWMKAIHDDGLTGWTHVSDLNFWGNAVAKLYVIQSIPQNFLLDKEGKIVAKNLRGKELETKLHEILGGAN